MLTTVAPVLDPVAPVLDPSLTTVAPVLDPVAPALDPVASALDPVYHVAPVLDPVAPVLDPVLTTVAPVLDPVAPVLDPVLATVAPVLDPIVDPVRRFPSGSGPEPVGAPSGPRPWLPGAVSSALTSVLDGVGAVVGVLAQPATLAALVFAGLLAGRRTRLLVLSQAPPVPPA